MTPEQQVITRDLAEQLWAIKVPQESYWAWDLGRDDWVLRLSAEVPAHHTLGLRTFCYAAYTLSELITLLGDDFLQLGRWHAGGFSAVSRTARQALDDTPQDALGSLLLQVWNP